METKFVNTKMVSFLFTVAELKQVFIHCVAASSNKMKAQASHFSKNFGDSTVQQAQPWALWETDR